MLPHYLKNPFKNGDWILLDMLNLQVNCQANWYILIATNYAIKWVRAQALHTNIVIVTAKFLYKHFLTRFGFPSTIMTNQGTHFINNVIGYLIDHFILRHISFSIYYPQGNGHVEFTNKVFGTLLAKLVNENINDWDEPLSIVLFSY